MQVSQKIFLKNPEGKLLALLRSETDPSRPLSWDLPGGGLEEGEKLEDSIRREIREEIGIEVGEISVFAAESDFNKNGKYSVQIAYIGTVDNPTITLSYEHKEYRWITRDEFLALESSYKIKKFLQKLPA